jgi:hypothetical protein
MLAGGITPTEAMDQLAGGGCRPHAVEARP